MPRALVSIALLLGVACGGPSAPPPVEPDPAREPPAPAADDTAPEASAPTPQPAAPTDDAAAPACPPGSDVHARPCDAIWLADGTRPAGELPRPPVIGRPAMSEDGQAQGLPAVSGDGRLVAVLDSRGDGYASNLQLLSLRVSDHGVDRTDPLLSYSADEEPEDDAAQRAFDREVARNATKISRYLERRRFRAMRQLPIPSEPHYEGLPVLVAPPETGDAPGMLLIRSPGPGPILHRGSVPAPEEIRGEEEECALDRPDVVRAYFDPDSRLLLVEAIYGQSTPDGCLTYSSYAVHSLP